MNKTNISRTKQGYELQPCLVLNNFSILINFKKLLIINY